MTLDFHIVCIHSSARKIQLFYFYYLDAMIIMNSFADSQMLNLLYMQPEQNTKNDLSKLPVTSYLRNGLILIGSTWFTPHEIKFKNSTIEERPLQKNDARISYLKLMFTLEGIWTLKNFTSYFILLIWY